MHNRVVIFGDNIGIAQLIHTLPDDRVKGIVASSIRPQYIEELRETAARRGIPFFIQERYGSNGYGEFINEVKKMHFDMLLCNSYSMIIRREILENVHFNAINIHGSLLPFNRGPNPTQWAIIKGETVTGVTMHYMDEGLDTGDIIGQLEEKILETDTWVTVNKRLSEIAIELIRSNINSILAGTNKRRKQDEKIGSVNKRLRPEFPRIDFDTMDDRQIFNLIRAQVFPLTGAYILREGRHVHFNKYLTLEEVKSLRKKYVK